MKLQRTYNSIDDVPEGFADLYTEQDGKAVFTAIAGMPSEDDVSKLQESLNKERSDHKETKKSLRRYEALGDYDDITSKMDRFEELEAAADGKLDEEKINELAEKRAASKIAPLQRELDELKEEREEVISERDNLRQKDTRRTIQDQFTPVLNEQKIVPEAREDINLWIERLFELNDEGKAVTRDGVGLPPGLTPDQWLQDQQEKRPHWWPQSQGGGASGSGSGGMSGPNPWSKENWNVTKQGQYLREHGAEKAERAAKAAGSKLGGLKPA